MDFHVNPVKAYLKKTKCICFCSRFRYTIYNIQYTLPSPYGISYLVEGKRYIELEGE